MNRAERREVAARLRNAEIENLGIYGYSTHLGEAIGECVRLVSGHECLVENGLNRLADLIEPEPERTCRIKQKRCTNCDHEINDRAYFVKVVFDDGSWTADSRTANFCPNCGTKVVWDD